jgi:hypothetical protein
VSSRGLYQGTGAEGLRGHVGPLHVTDDEDRHEPGAAQTLRDMAPGCPEPPRREVERREVRKTYTAPDGSAY